MKKFNVFVVILQFLYFLFSWLCYYAESIDELRELGTENLLNIMFAVGSGYNSIFYHNCFNLFAFIIVLHVASHFDNCIFVTRYTARNRLFAVRTVEVFKRASVFSLLYCLVFILLMGLFFDLGIAFNLNVILRLLLIVVMLTLHYSVIGLLYHCIHDFVKSFSLALFLTFIVFMLLTIVSVSFYIDFLFAINNPSIALYLLAGESGKTLLARYVIEIAVVVFTLSIGEIVHGKKEFLSVKKT